MSALTEEEAKKKWCPFYRVATSGGDMHTYEMDNRPLDEPHTAGAPINRFACCIASQCMAWRWDNISQRRTVDDRTEYFAGRCGLAGQS